jgi:hypothetical protein
LIPGPGFFIPILLTILASALSVHPRVRPPPRTALLPYPHNPSSSSLRRLSALPSSLPPPGRARFDGASSTMRPGRHGHLCPSSTRAASSSAALRSPPWCPAAAVPLPCARSACRLASEVTPGLSNGGTMLPARGGGAAKGNHHSTGAWFRWAVVALRETVGLKNARQTLCRAFFIEAHGKGHTVAFCTVKSLCRAPRLTKHGKESLPCVFS